MEVQTSPNRELLLHYKVLLRVQEFDIAVSANNIKAAIAGVFFSRL